VSSASRTCALHANHSAVAICCTCQIDICAACHHTNPLGYAICPGCKETLRAFEQTLFPWEQASFSRLPQTFFRTSANVLFKPFSFFTDLAFWTSFDKQKEGGFGRAIAFGLICTVFGMVITLFYQYLFVDDFLEIVRTTIQENDLPAEVNPDTLLTLLFLMIPLLGILAFLAHWFVLEMGLRLLGAQTKWSISGRVAAYSSAAYLAKILPPIGGYPIGYLVAIGFLIQLETTAIRVVYRLPAGKTFLVILLPFLITILVHQ